MSHVTTALISVMKVLLCHDTPILFIYWKYTSFGDNIKPIQAFISQVHSVTHISNAHYICIMNKHQSLRLYG